MKSSETLQTTADMAEVRLLEELALCAWPSLMTVHDDGLVVRLADGYTKRANSANALYRAADASEDALLARIGRASEMLTRHGLPPVFRLSPLADPRLDRLLEAQGFARFDETVVMVAPHTSGAADARVEVRPGVADDWIAAYAGAVRLSRRQTATLTRMMGLIAPRHATARVTAGGAIVGFGLGVADRGHIGAFEILIAPSARRQGLARAIMQALLAWGASVGATRAYLQVVATNAPAIALYQALGYRERYRYHYRIRTEDDAP